MTTQQTIRVSSGAAERTFPVTITEDTGEDISAKVVMMSLAPAPDGYFTARTWVTPSVDTPQTDHATRVVQLLVDSSTAVGVYWVWVKVTDTPEIVPRRAHKVIVT